MKYTIDTLPKKFTFFHVLEQGIMYTAHRVEGKMLHVSWPGGTVGTTFFMDDAVDNVNRGEWFNITPIVEDTLPEGKFYVQTLAQIDLASDEFIECEVQSYGKVKVGMKGSYSWDIREYSKEHIITLIKQGFWVIVEGPKQENSRPSNDVHQENPYVRLLPFIQCLMSGPDNSIFAYMPDDTFFVLENETDAQALLDSFITQDALRAKQE